MASNQYMNVPNPPMQPPRMEQVVLAASGPVAPNAKDLHRMSIYKLGISEVVLGGVGVLLWVVSMIMAVSAPPHCSYYRSDDCYPIDFAATYVSGGLWCGIFPIMSGALGIHMRDKPTTCMHIANLAMSVIAAVMMGVLIILSCIAAAVYETSLFPAIRIPHILLAALALAMMIICIAHSALCCSGVCCQRKNQGEVTYTAPPQQYVQLPNGQLMLVHAQPMLPQNYPVMMNQPPNFQQAPIVVAPTAPMIPPATTVYPTEAMSVTAIPSQPAPAQAPMPQPSTTEAKQEGATQSQPFNPPGYST